MKRILLLFLLFSTGLNAQLTTDPEIPFDDQAFTIFFNATGTALENTNQDLYAHTGVTINGEHWQNVISDWGESDQPKFTKVQNNLYSLEISPDVYSFYGVDTALIIQGIDMVVRTDDANTQTGDLFLEVYEGSFVISISEPNDGQIFDVNQAINLRGISSYNADLSFQINSQTIAAESSVKELISSYTPTSPGHYEINLTGNYQGEMLSESIEVFAKAETQSQALPSGLKDGINIQGNTVSFVLTAPGKESVFLIGDFNDWSLDNNYQMFKDDDKFWISLSDLNPDIEYAYQYAIDDGIKIADPHAYKVLDPNNDSSIPESTYPNLKAYPEKADGIVSVVKINRPAFQWTDENFVRPNVHNAVIYELLVRDFDTDQNFQDVIDRMDYLENLGITAIELMPVNEFENNLSWGYNPSFYKALDKYYGTAETFKTLINEAHKRGIAIYLDVVFNHSYSQSPLLAMYWNSSQNRPAADNPWYNETTNFENPGLSWGQDFNHESGYTTEFFESVISYWVEEYHIDGFRFDFTKGFSNTYHSEANDPYGSNYDASRIEILKNYADYIWDNHGSDMAVIFEHLANNDEETELADYGIQLWVNANYNWSQNTMGFNTDNNINWTDYKVKGWNNPNNVTYMESHDEDRMMFRNLNFGNSVAGYDVKLLQNAIPRVEGAFLIAQALRGPKMIWQFGERGYDISIDDETTGGRLGEKPPLWTYMEDPLRKHLYNTVSTINHFKRDQEDLSSDQYTLNDDGLFKSLVIDGTETNFVILVNFGMQSYTFNIDFPSNEIYYDYFDGLEIQGGQGVEISLKPGAYKFYSSKALEDPLKDGSGDTDNDGVPDENDLCPNTLEGTPVNETGCPVIEIPNDNFIIQTTGETCQGKANGNLYIEAEQIENYILNIDENQYSFSSQIEYSNLSPGSYSASITLENEPNYFYSFEFVIQEAQSLTGQILSEGFGDQNLSQIQIDSGIGPYQVFVNNVFQKEIDQNTFEVLAQGGDLIQVKTSEKCQGLIEHYVPKKHFHAYPNPFVDHIKIDNPERASFEYAVYNSSGALISSGKSKNELRVKIDFNDLKPGYYYLKVSYSNKEENFTFLKH